MTGRVAPRFFRSMIAALALSSSAGVLAQPLPTASPESVGMSPERLERITATFTKEIDDKKLPGAVVMVARHGKLVYAKSFGSLNNAAGAPMQDDSIFRIYSMTKPLVSTALMMLVEDGRVQLTDPVSKFLPSFKNPMVSVATFDPVLNGATFKLAPANREPTIQDLLRHTSGLAYGELTKNTLVRDAYIKAGVYKPDLDFDSRESPGPEMAERVGKAPLAHQPGTNWEYSVSVDVQGRVVEAVTGQRLGDFMKERMFTPLKMKDTGFFVPAAGQDPARRTIRQGSRHRRSQQADRCEHATRQRFGRRGWREHGGRLPAVLPGDAQRRSARRHAHSLPLDRQPDDLGPSRQQHQHRVQPRRAADGRAWLHVRTGLHGQARGRHRAGPRVTRRVHVGRLCGHLLLGRSQGAGL